MKKDLKAGRQMGYVRDARVASTHWAKQMLARQLDAISDATSPKEAWKHMGDYVDEGRAGGPGIMSLIGEIASGELKVEMILICDVDRLGRGADVIDMIRTLNNRGVVVVLAKDGTVVRL